MNEIPDMQNAAISLAKLYKTVCNLNFGIELDGEACLQMSAQDISHIPQLFNDVSSFLYRNPKESFVRQIFKMPCSPTLMQILEGNGRSKGKQREILVKFYRDIDELKCFLRQQKVFADGNEVDLPDMLRSEEALSLLQRAVEAGLLKDNYRLSRTVTKSQAYTIAYAVIHILGLGRGSWACFEILWYGRNNRLSSAYVPKHRVSHIERVKNLYPECNFVFKWRV